MESLLESFPLFSSTIHRVVKLEIIGDYTIHLTFADQSERSINFEPVLIGPVFGSLKDLDLFNQVTLDDNFGTLQWPNGADIDPTVLHDWPDHVQKIIERRKENFAVAQG